MTSLNPTGKIDMFRKLSYDVNRRQISKCVLIILIGILIDRLFFVSDLCLLQFDNYPIALEKKINESHEKNLILTTAIKMPLLDIYRFIRTARSTCNYCYIVILTDDVNNNDYKQLSFLYNILFLSYDKYKPKAMKYLSVYSLRFLIYYVYLLNQKYDNVFVCDLRDTFFQRNIFEEMKPYANGQIYAFLESEQITIGQCKLHREWISSCYGRDALMSIYNQSRSCAGSILGTYEGMLRYLSLMNSHIQAQPKCNDQGIHNYIVYHILNDTSTIRITHETGFLGTLGTTEWVYRNKYGLVLNKNGQVYSVVHQFYHSEQITRQANQEYQILPEDILTLKH